jgi:hypothetical protein
VVADASQQARAAEGACRRVAWISVASGVVLVLLIPVGWYGAYRAKPGSTEDLLILTP